MSKNRSQAAQFFVLPIIVSILFSGCVFSTEDDETGNGSSLPRGGTWKASITGESPNEETKAYVRLEMTEEQTADGVRNPVPVLDVTVPNESNEHETDRLRYFLQPGGIKGFAGTGAVVVSGGLQESIEGDAIWPYERVVYRENLVVGGSEALIALQWFLLGAGVWNHDFETEGPLEIMTYWGPNPRILIVDATPASTGCMDLRYLVSGHLEAEALFCEGALPKTITMNTPVNAEVTLEQVEKGASLHPAPKPMKAQSEPVNRAPADRSSLPLDLEEVVKAIESDPRSSEWLDAHPNATAVQGSYHVVPNICIEHSGTTFDTCTKGPPYLYRDIPYGEKIVEWNLSWSSQNGDWMDTTVAKEVQSTNGIPVVRQVEMGAGAPRGANINETVSFEVLLDRWARYDAPDFVFDSLHFDLTDQGRLTVAVLLEPPDGSPFQMTAHVRLESVFRLEDGLMEDGWRGISLN